MARLTLGTFKKWINRVPDDTEIFVSDRLGKEEVACVGVCVGVSLFSGHKKLIIKGGFSFISDDEDSEEETVLSEQDLLKIQEQALEKIHDDGTACCIMDSDTDLSGSRDSSEKCSGARETQTFQKDYTKEQKEEPDCVGPHPAIKYV